MEVSRGSFILLQALLGLFIVCIAIAVAYLVLHTEVDVSDSEAEVVMARLTTSAMLYFDKLQFYDGVCADIGTPRGFTCHDSETAYAIETKLKSGSYYCVDSAGFSGNQDFSKGVFPYCQYRE